MFHNILNKLFNRDDDDGEPKKTPPAAPEKKPPPEPKAPERPPDVPRHQDIPNRIEIGIDLKAIPAKLPGKPRAWPVKVTSFAPEGFWVARTDPEDEVLPTNVGELLTLVLFDNKLQLTYDCPVLRIEGGTVEKVLVGPPTKTLQEESQMQNLGGRKHLRINFRLPAEIRTVLGGELGPPISGHTRDISMSGLAVECPQEFDAGAEIEIRILSWNFPLKVRAFVVRCGAEEGKNIVAVSFPPDLSTISQDLIGQFILENQRNV